MAMALVFLVMWFSFQHDRLLLSGIVCSIARDISFPATSKEIANAAIAQLPLFIGAPTPQPATRSC
jgi:hypothetical protein